MRELGLWPGESLGRFAMDKRHKSEGGPLPLFFGA